VLPVKPSVVSFLCTSAFRVKWLPTLKNKLYPTDISRIFALLSENLNSSDTAASKDGMLDEHGIENDVRGSCLGLMWGNITVISWRN